LKEFLSEQEADYEVKDITTDLEARKHLIDDLHAMLTPVSEVFDAAGKVVEVINGFDKAKFEEHLKK